MYRDGLSRLLATDLDVVAAHAFEIRVAERAFAIAAGLPDPFPTRSRESDVDALDEAYRVYGLSSGVQATRHLVREIEASARAQAAKISR
jgi:hypothetical protein